MQPGFQAVEAGAGVDFRRVGFFQVLGGIGAAFRRFCPGAFAVSRHQALFPMRLLGFVAASAGGEVFERMVLFRRVFHPVRLALELLPAPMAVEIHAQQRLFNVDTLFTHAAYRGRGWQAG